MLAENPRGHVRKGKPKHDVGFYGLPWYCPGTALVLPEETELTWHSLCFSLGVASRDAAWRNLEG